MCTGSLVSNPLDGTYRLVYETEGQLGREPAESFARILDRAAELAIDGSVIFSLDGPDGPISHDVIDQWVYRKLAAQHPE